MSFVVAVIIACEIGFWVLLGAGLATRYLLRRPRAGMVLLALTPVVDLILLTAAVIDLRSGAAFTIAHGIAAVYIGYSLFYGHRLISWADGWAAHRWNGAPRPRARYGGEYTRHQWASVMRTMGAVGTATVLLFGVRWLADGRADVLPLLRLLGILLVVDVVWAASYTVWPRKQPAAV